MNTAEATIYYNNQIPCLSERPGQLVTGMCLVTLATGSSLGPCPSSYIGSPPYYGMRGASFLSLASVTSIRSSSGRPSLPPPFFGSRSTAQQEKYPYYPLQKSSVPVEVSDGRL